MAQAKTYRINIQIRFSSVVDQIRDRYVMGPAIEFGPGEKRLLELVRARIPSIRRLSVVEGGAVWSMVTPLGPNNPNRGPIEGHRGVGPELCRQSERSAVVVSGETVERRSIIDLR